MRSTRLVSFTQRAIAAIRYEVEPLDGAGPAGRAVRAGRQRAAARHASGDPRAAAVLDVAAGARGRTSATDARGGARALDARAAGCGWRRRWTTSSTGRHGTDVSAESCRRPRPSDRHRRCAPGQRLRLSSSSPTAGRGERIAAGAARPGRARRWRGARTPAGTGLLDEQRAYLDDFWDARRRRDRRRRRAAAGGALRALPRARRPAPGPSAARSRQGPDRPGLRRPRASGTPRRSCCRCSRTPRPRAAADALRWRHSTLPTGAGARASSWASRARRSRGARSTARSARATGRPARPRFTSTPTSPTPSSATVDATGDDAFERDVGAGAAGRDGPAVALARPPRRRTARSASTASPAPTSTARSPTTTSTRT